MRRLYPLLLIAACSSPPPEIELAPVGVGGARPAAPAAPDQAPAPADFEVFVYHQAAPMLGVDGAALVRSDGAVERLRGEAPDFERGGAKPPVSTTSRADPAALAALRALITSRGFARLRPGYDKDAISDAGVRLIVARVGGEERAVVYYGQADHPPILDELLEAVSAASGGAETVRSGPGAAMRDFLSRSPGALYAKPYREPPAAAPGALSEPEIYLRSAKIKGPIEPYIVQGRLVAEWGPIEDCYRRALAATPRLEGKLTVALSISRAGAVSAAKVKSGALSPALDGCVLGLLRGVSFFAPRGKAASAELPIEFKLPRR
jgi:TonB family protein